MKNERTEHDAGEIFRIHGQEYERSHNMTSEQRKALRAIASCRTSVLGGHLERCRDCGFEHPVYNSCRNSNCPKCQGIKRRQWVDKRVEELLPVPYFHVIFTLPDIFNSLSISHYREFHGALFRAAAETLLYFFRKSGGEPAIIAMLHTWGQTMCLHPHIHMLVTGGGLSFDRKRWIKLGRNYLFDVTVLSDEFKRRFLKEIGRKIPGFEIPDDIREKAWVVHCRKPFAGAAKIVEYLGRYIYRSVISNRRILDFSGGKVTIDYKDYRDTDKNDVPEHKTMPLSASEFIRRFLQHIPPANFRRVRFYGILAGRERSTKLETARELLAIEGLIAEESAATATPPENTSLCAQCETGIMEVVKTLLPHGPPPVIFRNEIIRGEYAA